jgi:hypothetical protein
MAVPLKTFQDLVSKVETNVDDIVPAFPTDKHTLVETF